MVDHEPGKENCIANIPREHIMWDTRPTQQRPSEHNQEGGAQHIKFSPER